MTRSVPRRRNTTGDDRQELASSPVDDTALRGMHTRSLSWHEGFTKSSNTLLRDPSITAVDLRILLVILSFDFKETGCWPSVATIARAVGLTDRYVSERIQYLERRRLLEIVRRPGRSSTYRRTFSYLSTTEPQVRGNGTTVQGDPITAAGAAPNHPSHEEDETEEDEAGDKHVEPSSPFGRAGCDKADDPGNRTMRTAADLARYFVREVEALPGASYVGPTNEKALAHNIKRWLRDGLAVQVVHEMIDLFLARVHNEDPTGTVLWRRFIYMRQRLANDARRITDAQAALTASPEYWTEPSQDEAILDPDYWS